MVIKEFRLEHNDSGNYDGGHSYINAYVDLMWVENCTVTGIINDINYQNQNNGGFHSTFPDLNGTHQKGEIQTIQSGGDAAYDKYVAKSAYDFTNAKVSYV